MADKRPARRPRATNRERIADAAMELFAERGFDRVAVAEVAAAAGVTEKTVFNNFPTKEDLVYAQDEEFENALLDAVRTRPPGESFTAAVRGFLLAAYGRGLPGGAALKRARTLARLVSETPALRRREREILARYADRLAEELASELGTDHADLRPAVVAHALVGVHQSVIAGFRKGLRDREPVAALTRRMLVAATEAFDLLEGGFSAWE